MVSRIHLHVVHRSEIKSLYSPARLCERFAMGIVLPRWGPNGGIGRPFYIGENRTRTTAHQNYQDPREVLELRSGTNTGALCARMYDRMHHASSSERPECRTRSARSQIRVVEGRDVIQIRIDANHSGQRLAVKLKLHYTFWVRFCAVLEACRSKVIVLDR